MTDILLKDIAVSHDASLSSTITITIASPGVISWTGHPLAIGQAFQLSTTGALPTPLAAATFYYVISASFEANSFQFAATPGGSAINTSGTQSGTHTIQGVPADDTWAEVQRVASATTSERIPLSSLIKAYVKSFITKSDVGLSNVSNVAQRFIAPKSGRYYAFPDVTCASAATTTSASRIHWVPVKFGVDTTLSAIAFKISSTGAAGNIKAAVYAADATSLYPTGTPLAYTGNASTATPSVMVDALFSGGSGSNFTFVAATLYWLGITTDATGYTSSTFNAQTSSVASLIGSTAGLAIAPSGSSNGTYFTDNTYGSAWPTMTGVEPQYPAGNFPCPYMKAA